MGPASRLVGLFLAQASGGQGGARGPGGLLMRQGESQISPAEIDTPSPPPTPAMRQSLPTAHSNCFCLCHLS